MAAAFDKYNPVPWFKEQTFVNLNIGYHSNVKITRDNIGNQPKIGEEIDRLYSKNTVKDTLQFPSTSRWKIQVMNSTMALSLDPKGGSFFRSDNGVRYLPWKPDHCTFMKLDGKSQFAITGPLSGCNVYVAGDPSAPWFFHANLNKDASATGEATKRKWPLDLLSTGIAGSAPVTVGGALERAHYTGREYMGLVFGYKNGNAWQFYFHGNSPNGTMLRRLI